MTIKATFDITDAELEAGIAQGLAVANAASGNTATAEEFCVAAALAALEAYRGSAARAVLAEAAALPADKLAALAADIAPAVAAKVAEVAAEKQAAKDAAEAAAAAIIP